MSSKYCLFCAALVAVAVVSDIPQAHALDPAPKCESGKLKEAGKYASCRLKADSVAIKKGVPADYTKCVTKFGVKWDKIETKGAGQCPTNGDLSDRDEAAVRFSNETAGCLSGGACITCVDDLATCLQGCPTSPAALLRTGQVTSYGAGSDGAVQHGIARSHSDNGDGTITDNSTGLMWEKKDDSAGIHDQDNSYTWSGPSYGTTNIMDGTITTTFLDTLNDVAGGGVSCFAGQCDWRIPNVKELQSIVDYGASLPSIDPAFNNSCAPGCTVTTCSCTASSFYWSSSTYDFTPLIAWYVFFSDGYTFNAGKSSINQVRAVRGGS